MASLLTSDQVNYLVWRYLQESGFQHSVYSFQHESKAHRFRNVFGPSIKTGSLIYLIQRGLQYLECTSLVNKDGSRKKSAEPFCYFPAVSTTVDVEDEGVGDEENGHVPEDEDDPMVGSNSPTAVSTTTQTTSSRKHGRDDGGTNGVSSTKRRKKALQGPDGDVSMADGFPDTPTPAEEPRTTNGCSVGTQVEDVVKLTAADSILLGQEDKSVLTCAWNPVHSTVLATASTDSIARIWNVPLDANPSTQIPNKVISHDPSNSAKRDVTALRWSPQGDLLAAGSYDGKIRVWTTDGLLHSLLPLGTCPVVNLKWNKSADALLSLSCDGRIIAWDPHTGDMRRSYEQGEESVADMDWVDDTQFVACGDKGNVFRYNLENDGPLSVYRGHVGEVRCLMWDDISDRLATGGEDNTVLVWQKPSKGSSSTPERKLIGHTSSIVSLSWQPLPTNSPLPLTRRILASASNDCTIRLWDTISQTCLHILKQLTDPIERISFSPDGARLASGANGWVVVWRTENGAVTHVYDGMTGRKKNGVVKRVVESGVPSEEGEISEISWDEGGVRVAVGGGELKVSVLRQCPGGEGKTKGADSGVGGQCSIIRLNTKPLL